MNDRAPVQGPATTDPVQGENANESCHLHIINTYSGNRHKGTYHVGNGVQPRDPLHLVVRDTSGTEDGRSEDSHTGDTDPLLHDLKPDNELYTAASVEFARADTEKHSNVRLAFGGLAFELCDVANILEFGLSFANIFTGLASKTAKNIASLVFAANLDEPTGGLGEEPADCKEEQQRGNLECNRESPGELACSSLIKVAATGRIVSDRYKHLDRLQWSADYSIQ